MHFEKTRQTEEMRAATAGSRGSRGNGSGKSGGKRTRLRQERMAGKGEKPAPARLSNSTHADDASNGRDSGDEREAETANKRVEGRDETEVVEAGEARDIDDDEEMKPANNTSYKRGDVTESLLPPIRVPEPAADDGTVISPRTPHREVGSEATCVSAAPPRRSPRLHAPSVKSPTATELMRMAASADSSGVTKSKKPVTRAAATQFRATLARHQLANVFNNDEDDSTQVTLRNQEEIELEV